VFVRSGFQGASVEQIATEAGFSRGAFYSNFNTKEELFVELLHDQVYDAYRELLESVPKDLSPREKLRWAAREAEERYANRDDSWLFALWLECLAHAARNPDFRPLPATFWSGTRAMNEISITEAFEEAGRPLPIEARHLATAMTALDIGLALQNLVDPEAVPLDLYPKLYELLFGGLIDPTHAG